jgi:hypothetical protein
MLSSEETVTLASSTYSVIAGAAVDRTIILRQEWDLRLGATLCTDDCMHLAGGALRAISSSAGCRTACSTAGRAASRLIHQAFLLVELLFSSRKYEVVSALTAVQGFVNETQLGTSL